ncbi:MAG: acyltransferase domain-containing protein [Actinocatenispora sp.]
MSTVHRPFGLLLPGQGAQHPGMAWELYAHEPVFTETIDEFFELMGPDGWLLREDWLSEQPAVPLDDASRAQPLLFGIGYALGRSLSAIGVQPTVLLGHSIGELAAAALAGVFDLASAARLMVARSAAMARTPAGGMLAVAATPDQLAAFLDDRDRADGVVVGAWNAPMQTIVAGAEPRLSECARALREAGIACRPVLARQPFHSPASAGAAAEFTAAFAAETLRPPTVRIWSTRTGRPVSDAEAVDPEFWAGQLAEPVMFWPALDALLRDGAYTLVEAGPGRGLSTVARRHRSVRQGASSVVPVLATGAEGSLHAWWAAAKQLVS